MIRVFSVVVLVLAAQVILWFVNAVTEPRLSLCVTLAYSATILSVAALTLLLPYTAARGALQRGLRECLENASQSQELQESTLRWKQLLYESNYWIAFVGLFGLQALAMFFPFGPADMALSWLQECIVDANLSYNTSLDPAWAFAIKTGGLAYLLWWTLPSMSKLSGILARAGQQLVNETSCSYPQSLLSAVKNRHVFELHQASNSFHQCILSLVWIVSVYAGIFACLSFHPGVVGKTMAQVYSYAGDLNSPSRIFFTALFAAWATPFMAVFGCVWLPFRNRPQLIVTSEGMQFPFPQMHAISLWVRPLRFWEDLASVDFGARRIVFKFRTGGTATIAATQLKSEEVLRLISLLNEYAKHSVLSGVEAFTTSATSEQERAATPAPPLFNAPAPVGFVADNLSFTTTRLDRMPVHRQMILGVPVLIVLLLDKLASVAFSNDPEMRIRTKSCLRPVLNRLLDYTVDVPRRYVYAFSCLAPVLIILFPQVFLPMAICATLAACALNVVVRIMPGPREDACELNKDLYDCAQNFKPFLMWGLYTTGVGSFLLIGVQSIAALLKGKQKPARLGELTLQQNSWSGASWGEYNFYHSKWFPITLSALYLVGLPTLILWICYWNSGLDAIMGYPSFYADFNVLVWIGSGYLGGIGCTASVLFFRSWFCYLPDNGSTEYDLVLDETGLKQKNVKGWFAEFLYYGWYEFFPRHVDWNSVVAIDYEEAGFGQLAPLPTSSCQLGPVATSALSNLAMLTDAIVEYFGRAKFVVIRTRYDKAFGHGVKIRLADLNASKKQELLLSLQQRVPHAIWDERVEEALAA